MSTPTHKNYLTSNTNRLHEINWCKARIRELVPLLTKKPSTIRQIRDLERQIVERGGAPDPLPQG